MLNQTVCTACPPCAVHTVSHVPTQRDTRADLGGWRSAGRLA